MRLANSIRKLTHAAHQMRRRLLPNRWWFWIGVAVLFSLRWMTYSPARGERDFAVNPIREGPCKVARVVSGETLVVIQDPSRDEITIKLLSTQAPRESDGEALVAEARRFAEAFVQRGEVKLELDKHRLDSRGRYLAYIECDGAQLNEALLRAGLARFYYFPGNSASMDRRLKEAEEAAQAAKVGLWRKSQPEA
jgi:endonuclease YncB( thermonuclease family)